MLCKKIYRHDNFDAIREEVKHILQTVDNTQDQIICQTTEEGIIDWHTGIGNLRTLKEKKEKSYKFINPLLKGTELEKFILTHNAFRTRIMIMHPRKCYSIHNDWSLRIHLPIITNEQCWMIWPKKSECYQLTEGNVYWTDTREYHTFINGSQDHTRVHLVLCVDQ
jgi:hypothetical protein